MANRRMLSKTVSTSKKLARVSDGAAVLFLCTIPHCDDNGNMDADPLAVKGIVVPMRPVTVDDVQEQIKELAEVELITIYNGKKDEIFQHINQWEKFQTLRKDVIDMRYPIPKDNDTVTPRKRHVTLTERNVTERNVTKHTSENVGAKKRAKRTTTNESTGIRVIVDWYFALKGWNDKKETNKIYGRHVRTAKDLLEICEEKVDYAKDRIERVAVWAGSRDLDWTLETVIKKFLDIDKLIPREKKPTWKGNPMYQRGGKWWVVMPNGEHLQFTSKKTEIKYV